MIRPPKSPRLRPRLSVRIRRQGGSLSITIPSYIVRAWKLEQGTMLAVHSTTQGILLFPRFFASLVGRQSRQNPNSRVT